MKSKEMSPGKGLGFQPSRSACLMTLIAWQVVQGAEIPASSASSSGTGASIDLSVLNLVNANSGNLGTSSGSAPAPYSVSKSAVELDLDVAVLVLDLVNADGVISTSAGSNVNGSPGSKTTTATSAVADLSLDVAEVLGILGEPPLIRLDVPAVTSAVTISGQGGSFSSTSNVSLTGMTLSVLGASIDLSTLDLANVPPNTGLDLGADAVAGLSIILNETQTVGSAGGGLTTTTNAIRIKLNSVNLGLINVLNGDIVIGRAQAKQASDPDGDGIFSDVDGDADGDGIPNAVELANAAPGGDTDGDGLADYLDLDSDNDGINDVVEAAGRDTNGDGRQDPSGDANADDDGDGIVDSVDPNDVIPGGGPGTALTVPDTDGDGAKNYLDLDSDNDGLSDVVESGLASHNDVNGVLRNADTDGDGIDDAADGSAGSGDAPGSSGAPLDADNDGIPNAYETDSDGNGTTDIAGTPYASLDGGGDGRIDNGADNDRDGVADIVDIQPGVFGGLPNPAGDNDGDGITNGNEGLGLVDTDADGLADLVDNDSDADGIPDLNEGAGDFDSDGRPNARDLDSDNDGVNDVIEGGGTDIDGNGLSDGSATVSLPLPDSDGDGAPNFLDLDSDNDTISDLVESGLGAVDTNNDGIAEGIDPDQDGIVVSVDGLPGARGDANGSAPIDSDGDGIPNYIDPNSDGSGSPDIVNAGNGALDGDGDGKVDNANDSDHDGIPDVADEDDGTPGGLGLDLQTYPEWVDEQFSSPANSNPLVSGQEADPDKDGFTNAEEFAFGTDPEDGSDFPEVITAPAGEGIQATVAKSAGAYAFVVVEGSRDLLIWLTGPGAVTATVDQPALLRAQINDALPGGELNRGFIRFRVIIP